VRGVSHKQRLSIVLWVATWVLVLLPAAAFASGDEVGANVSDLLRKYAGELYGGVVGIIAVVCLMNRRYEEVVVFLFASVAVAWMVFDPNDIATAAEAISKQIFG
jgi:hypothetical protein